MKTFLSVRRQARSTGLALGLVAAAMLLAACSGPADSGPSNTGGQNQPNRGGLHVAVITHGTSGDAFWNVVKNGVEAAGKQLGVSVTYSSDGDPGAQAKLIDNAVAQHVTGLVVSMANPDALREAIGNAVRQKIPVVTINSGEQRSAEFGAIAHVGQNEAIAGQDAGKRLKDAGRTTLLCVIHEAGNVGLSQRCDGAKTAFGNVRNLQVDISNPTDTQSRIKGALQADPSIDAVLALNPQVAVNAVNGAKESGSKAQVATFDLNPDVVSAIKAGEVLFAVDQQQFEQGYLPIVLLKLYQDNANTVGGGRPVLTGPGFVDKSNVNTVEALTRLGTR